MKRYLLTGLKVLLALVVTAALVKLAFFPDSEQTAPTAAQTGFSVSTPLVTVTKADVKSAVDIDGQVVADAPTQVPATAVGTVARLYFDNGAAVTSGEPILTIKKTETVTTTDNGSNGSNGANGSSDSKGANGSADSSDSAADTTPKTTEKVTYIDVYAPATGTINYSVIKDQETTVGTSIASISTGTYSATGTISAAQQYQLTQAPTSATITIKSGPAPFACNNLKIGTGTASAPTNSTAAPKDTTDASSGDGTTVQVRCAIPADKKVFPGLKATISIAVGEAKGALTVPLTAVQGNYATGKVWLVPDPTKPTKTVETTVKLGINDGNQIVVTSGLKEGDSILQFVPGQDVDKTGKPNSCDPDGTCYDSAGKEIK
ncbi:biotin-requiring enzyme [Actinomyces graevenitzii]|uniref:efflux RND transporter periplasmic adaptor subunit n=1 Tax=Actinomyces graevenitzii TaxID=55565 RepID=UPI000C8082CD|nr:efflux RND transporter periplasmic adaptor subunit [Actinomyces graevenitzii]PMC91282.1 biotin-requiring enzyme [Actinomyces graevenitzii]